MTFVAPTPNNLAVIGLTGGIASGKSTVTDFFAKQDAIVINGDLLGHEAYKKGTKCLQQMVDHFGERILTTEGTVDRTVLGPIVFGDKSEMEKLNAIVWPAICELIRAQIKDASDHNTTGKPKIVVVEAAVLIEANWKSLFDEIWIVSTQKEIAKQRLMKRNNLNDEQAEQRIAAQMSMEEREKHGLIIVSNNGSKEECEHLLQVEYDNLIKRYSGLSSMEFVDVVDQNDVVLKSCKRAQVRAFNLWHRATYIILVHAPTGKFYVQKRSNLKDYCPSMLDPAPGGVVGAGEDPTESAYRELNEEMGVVDVPLKSLGTFAYDGEKTKCIGYMFSCSIDVPIEQLKLQEEEVDEVMLLTKEEIMSKEKEIMPDGFHAFLQFQSKGGKI